MRLLVPHTRALAGDRQPAARQRGQKRTPQPDGPGSSILGPAGGLRAAGLSFIGLPGLVSGVQNDKEIASYKARMDAIRAETAANEARECVLW